MSVVAGLLLLRLGSFAFAQASVDGDLTLNFSRILDSKGNTTGYNYTGSGAVSLNYDVPFITVGIGVLPQYRDLQTHYWSEVYVWDDLTLAITNAVAIFPAVAGAGTGSPSLKGFFDTVHTLTNAGPTEKGISTPLKIESPDIAGFHVEFGLGLTVKFDATLATGSSMILDQTAVLEKLTVSSGASLIGRSDMIVRSDLVNHGFFGNLQGTVTGDFLNSGDPTKGERAIIDGYLTIGSQLTNSGEIRIESGAMTLSHATVNDGTIIIDNGTIQSAQAFSNFGTFKLRGGWLQAGQTINLGNFEWSLGQVRGTGLLNASPNFTILANTAANIAAGSGPAHGFARYSGMTNTGTVKQSGSGVVAVMQDVVINNQAGAVWELQNDTGFGFYNDFYNSNVPAVFNNAGTFRKSGGTGTSSIDGLSFQNTGTVEVTSGTLAFSGGTSRRRGPPISLAALSRATPWRLPVGN